MSYPLESLTKEVAYISYHFHWSKKSVLNMTHKERKIWSQEISNINKQINSGE